MHPVRLSFSRSSSAIRSSMWAVQLIDRRDHSRLSARDRGELVQLGVISPNDKPIRWANTMNAIRRNTAGITAMPGSLPFRLDQAAVLV